jgi:hypothetical protein
MRASTLALASALLAPPAAAAPLKAELAGLSFLLGSWTSGAGKVAETGGTSKGASEFTAEAGGSVLLRRDHTDLFDAAGKPAGGFDQLMTIYAEADAVHADYFDGTHIIHYATATIVPGRSVTFFGPAAPEAPAFKLTCELHGSTLAVTFAMAPPGQPAFRPIATGTMQRGG